MTAPERDEDTPSTMQVRNKYSTVLDDTAGWKWSDKWSAEFDRWLKRHDARVRAEGHREGYRTAQDDIASGAFIGGPNHEALARHDARVAADALETWANEVRAELAATKAAGIEMDEQYIDVLRNALTQAGNEAARIRREAGIEAGDGAPENIPANIPAATGDQIDVARLRELLDELVPGGGTSWERRAKLSGQIMRAVPSLLDALDHQGEAPSDQAVARDEVERLKARLAEMEAEMEAEVERVRELVAPAAASDDILATHSAECYLWHTACLAARVLRALDVLDDGSDAA